MYLASHNSWSYAPPKKFWLWPFRFMAKCQSKDIQLQYSLGVRMFDLRLFFTKQGEVSVRHGIMDFKVPYMSLLKDLRYLDDRASVGETVYVRVILELNHKHRRQQALEDFFKNYCYCLKNTYSNVTFVEGVRKYDWQQLYDFHTACPRIINRYSSTTSIFGGYKSKWYAKIDDFWPWLYAKCFNQKNYNLYREEDAFLMVDFI